MEALVFLVIGVLATLAALRMVRTLRPKWRRLVARVRRITGRPERTTRKPKKDRPRPKPRPRPTSQAPEQTSGTAESSEGTTTVVEDAPEAAPAVRRVRWVAPAVAGTCLATLAVLPLFAPAGMGWYGIALGLALMVSAVVTAVRITPSDGIGGAR